MHNMVTYTRQSRCGVLHLPQTFVDADNVQPAADRAGPTEVLRLLLEPVVEKWREELYNNETFFGTRANQPGGRPGHQARQKPKEGRVTGRLELKVGAQVMLLTNKDLEAESKLANGSRGTDLPALCSAQLYLLRTGHVLSSF